MASGLYTRVSGRGFPSQVAAGMTGEGALESQGGTVDPAHGETLTETGASTLPGSQPEGPAGPDGIGIQEGTWGLPGGTIPDQTPRTHAAPVPGWAGSYDAPELLAMHEDSAKIHAEDFGALAPRMRVELPEPELDIWSSNERGENVLQPLDGQIRAMGHGDVDQGYGFVNGHGFGAGHRTRITATDPQPFSYLDPAERPYIVPQASGSFAPTDAVQGPAPTGTFLDAGSINATAPTPYSPPAEPATAPAAPVGAPASTGWGW
jgi:hypothetical protein